MRRHLCTLLLLFSANALLAGPPLKEVAHDATLQGLGTGDAPLGLANAAVTAEKLAAGTPSTGQVLGFNGSSLAWQSPTTTPPTPSTRTFVIPHVLEKIGTITNTQFTFDTTIFATYTAGLPGVPGGSSATVDLYLYGNSGSATMKSATGTDVCNPCTFSLTTASRKVTIGLDEIIVSKGGFSAPVMLGYAVIVVHGDPANVSLQGFVINSHTNPFDLSVFGFAPVELQAAP